jgi:lipoprotein NlpI
MSRLERLCRLAAADPRDPFLQYGLGLEYAQLEQWDAALAAFEGALALDPQYHAAHLPKAQAELKLGRRDAARATLGAGIAVALARGEKHAADELRKVLDTLA